MLVTWATHLDDAVNEGGVRSDVVPPGGGGGSPGARPISLRLPSSGTLLKGELPW